MNQYKVMIVWSLLVSLQWFGHMKILYIGNFSAYFYIPEGVEIVMKLDVLLYIV